MILKIVKQIIKSDIMHLMFKILIVYSSALKILMDSRTLKCIIFMVIDVLSFIFQRVQWFTLKNCSKNIASQTCSDLKLRLHELDFLYAKFLILRLLHLYNKHQIQWYCHA